MTVVAIMTINLRSKDGQDAYPETSINSVVNLSARLSALDVLGTSVTSLSGAVETMQQNATSYDTEADTFNQTCDSKMTLNAADARYLGIDDFDTNGLSLTLSQGTLMTAAQVDTLFTSKGLATVASS